MKKLIIALGMLACIPSIASAGPPWVSSNTATAETAQALCRQSGTTRRGVLHGVCVNRMLAGGSITVYNSSSTAVNPVAVILSTQAATTGCSYYDIYMSTGITYTTSAANDVTFMYECY